MPYLNNLETVVHKVAIEDLSVADTIKNTIPSENSKSSTERHSRHSSPTNNILEGVVEKLVTKMVVHGLNIPEESNDAACK